MRRKRWMQHSKVYQEWRIPRYSGWAVLILKWMLSRERSRAWWGGSSPFRQEVTQHFGLLLGFEELVKEAVGTSGHIQQLFLLRVSYVRQRDPQVTPKDHKTVHATTNALGSLFCRSEHQVHGRAQLPEWLRIWSPLVQGLQHLHLENLQHQNSIDGGCCVASCRVCLLGDVGGSTAQLQKKPRCGLPPTCGWAQVGRNCFFDKWWLGVYQTVCPVYRGEEMCCCGLDSGRIWGVPRLQDRLLLFALANSLCHVCPCTWPVKMFCFINVLSGTLISVCRHFFFFFLQILYIITMALID